MVPLSTSSAAVLPVAGEAEIIGGFAANVVVAEVIVETLGVAKQSSALLPSARERVGGQGVRSGCAGWVVAVRVRRRGWGGRRGRELGWRCGFWFTGLVKRGMFHGEVGGEQLVVQGRHGEAQGSG